MIALFLCAIITSSSLAQSLYFHEQLKGSRLSKLENDVNLKVMLTLSTNRDMSVYDKIIVRTYGSKYANGSESLHSSTFFPVKQFLQDFSREGLYSIEFLRKIDHFIWTSEMGLQNLGVGRHNYVRATVSGVMHTRDGSNAYPRESHIASSNWLEVRSIKRQFKNTGDGSALGAITLMILGFVIGLTAFSS